MRCGQLTDEIGFGLVGWGEVVDVFTKLSVIFFVRLAGQNDGFRGKAVFDRVQGDGPAALFGFWTERFRSIDAGGFGSGRHIDFLARV